MEPKGGLQICHELTGSKMSEACRDNLNLKTWHGLKCVVKSISIFTWHKVRQSIVPYKNMAYCGQWWGVVKNTLKEASEDTFKGGQ